LIIFFAIKDEVGICFSSISHVILHVILHVIRRVSNWFAIKEIVCIGVDAKGKHQRQLITSHLALNALRIIESNRIEL
jgi:hypothetical protein